MKVVNIKNKPNVIEIHFDNSHTGVRTMDLQHYDSIVARITIEADGGATTFKRFPYSYMRNGQLRTYSRITEKYIDEFRSRWM